MTSLRPLYLACCSVVVLTSGVVAARSMAAPAAPDARPVVGPGYDNTPFLPGSEWRVHDNRRPHPAVVDPGSPSTQAEPGRPPADAIVLFDGSDLSKWVGPKGQPPKWKLVDGHAMESVKKAGSIRTKQDFGSCQLHVEWAAPTPPHGNSQERGNSGVFLMGRYEIQVLDSYDNPTYADGQAASLYGQKPPDVNVCRKPGQWQTYDIAFEAPVFEGGKVVTPAFVTLFHNGVLVHNHVQLLGSTMHKKLAQYRPHPPKGPIQLQDHGSPVRYRNIWIRPLN